MTKEKLLRLLVAQEVLIEAQKEMIKELKTQIANHSCVMKMGGYHES